MQHRLPQISRTSNCLLGREEVSAAIAQAQVAHQLLVLRQPTRDR